MEEITFDFEDKLKQFIEENCGYNFNIEIKKDASGVHINKAVNKSAIFQELENIGCILCDMNGYDREHEQIELENAIDDCCENISALLEGE